MFENITITDCKKSPSSSQRQLLNGSAEPSSEPISSPLQLVCYSLRLSIMQHNLVRIPGLTVSLLLFNLPGLSSW